MSGQTHSSDLTRRIVVAVSAVLAIVGSFIGSGVAVGTPVQDAAGGALAADATLIAPGTGAFRIWSIIYLGLVAYAIWQFLPRQATDGRHRRLGYPIAASLLLNAAWILSIQFDLLWLSIPIIAALLAVLVIAFRITVGTRPKNLIETIVTDGTVGLYLGWVSVATAANVTAGLQTAGFTGFGLAPELWSVVVVAVAGLVGVAVAVGGAGRLAPAASLCWGIAWIAIARFTGEPASAPTAIAAVVAVIAVLVATIALRLTRGRALPL